MVPKSEALAKARGIVRTRNVASLATLLPDGSPYTSLVLTANLPSGEPLMYSADIAEHTHNVLRDPRASLLFEVASHEDEPMAFPRVGLVGSFTGQDDPVIRQLFLDRHPTTDPDLGGFRVFTFKTDRARLVGGFGDVRWVEGNELFPGR